MYGPFSRGRVGVVIGEGAPSGIWVHALLSGHRPWRYPDARGSDVTVGRCRGGRSQRYLRSASPSGPGHGGIQRAGVRVCQSVRSVVKRKGETVVSRDWWSPVSVIAVIARSVEFGSVRVKCGSSTGTLRGSGVAGRVSLARFNMHACSDIQTIKHKIFKKSY